MYEIENAQRELCEFLISMMPVEWSKICLYSECSTGYCSYWFALIEKKTGAICTQESFGKRYNSYPQIQEFDLYRRIKKLYNSYLEKFGEEKIWRTCFLTIEEDYTFHVELGYKLPEGDIIQKHDAIFEKFFNTKYEYLQGKYPY